MPLEFSHETLAETHDFGVGTSSRTEIRTTLSPTHGESGEAVFECLFESEEFHDGKVDAFVEADTSLVGTDGAVHLDAVATVDVDFAAVVRPGDTEHDDSFGLYDPFHDFEIHQMGIGGDVRCHAGDDLPDGLVEFLFTRVPCDHAGHEPVNIVLGESVHFIYTC